MTVPIDPQPCGGCPYYQPKLRDKSEYPKQCNWDRLLFGPFGDAPGNCPLGYHAPGLIDPDSLVTKKAIVTKVHRNGAMFECRECGKLVKVKEVTCGDCCEKEPQPGLVQEPEMLHGELSDEETQKLLKTVCEVSQKIYDNTKDKKTWLAFPNPEHAIRFMCAMGLTEDEIMEHLELAEKGPNGVTLHSRGETDADRE